MKSSLREELAKAECVIAAWIDNRMTWDTRAGIDITLQDNYCNKITIHACGWKPDSLDEDFREKLEAQMDVFRTRKDDGNFLGAMERFKKIMDEIHEKKAEMTRGWKDITPEREGAELLAEITDGKLLDMKKFQGANFDKREYRNAVGKFMNHMGLARGQSVREVIESGDDFALDMIDVMSTAIGRMVDTYPDEKMTVPELLKLIQNPNELSLTGPIDRKTAWGNSRLSLQNRNLRTIELHVVYPAVCIESGLQSYQNLIDRSLRLEKSFPEKAEHSTAAWQPSTEKNTEMKREKRPALER